MSTQVDVTLRRVIYELSEWASAHKMITDFFGYGEFLQVASEGERKYPAMVVNVTAAGSDRWYINYNFEVMFLQYVNDEQDNRERAMSDTREYLTDLEETITYSNRWQNFSRVDAPFGATPAVEKGRDKSFGWVGTFTLRVRKRNGICNLQALLPEYDFETGTITGPTCAPVSIFKDGVFEEDVASGGRFDYYTACADGSVTVNSLAFDTVASGGTLDVPVQYANGTPTGTNIGGIITIDNPIVCADATVNLNGVFNQTVASGGTANVIVENSEITVNGAAFDSLLPEEALNVPVEYENGTPIGTITAGVVVVPNPVSPLNTANVYKSGQTTSHVSGDDGETEIGRGSSFFILNHNNGFGNTNRFTDTLGLQLYANDVVVDWASWDQVNGVVLCYYRLKLGGVSLMSVNLANQPYSLLGFTDWRITNAPEMLSIFNWEVSRDLLNYPPFNISFDTGVNRIQVSTTDNVSFGYTINSTSPLQITNQNSTVAKYILKRYYTLAELGL